MNAQQRLESALKTLIRTDGCSNSWDIRDAVDGTISAIEQYVESRIKAALLLAAEEKIPTESKEDDSYDLLEKWLEIHDTECWYDHHGYCQEHFLEDKGSCIVELTRKILAARENKV